MKELSKVVKPQSSWLNHSSVSYFALCISHVFFFFFGCWGPLEAQWAKRWPTDLAVPGSSPVRGEIFSAVNGVPLHTAFHYSDRPDMTVKLLKRT